MHHLVTDPATGAVLHLPAGARLELRFRRPRLGESRWRIAEHPAHLVPLPSPPAGAAQVGRCAFHFVVFEPSGGGSSGPLRLERVRRDREEPCDVRELCVVTAARLLGQPA